jgi:hypothetical protein
MGGEVSKLRLLAPVPGQYADVVRSVILSTFEFLVAPVFRPI